MVSTEKVRLLNHLKNTIVLLSSGSNIYLNNNPKILSSLVVI